MKKTIRPLCFILAVLCCSAVAVFTCLAENESVTMSVLGDSIAAGYGVEADESYPALIGKEKNYTVQNDAVSGYTTADLLNLLKNDKTVRDNLANADITVVSIGGNDIIAMMKAAGLSEMMDIMLNKTEAKCYKETAALVRNGVADACSELKKLNPDMIIILQTLYNPLYANEQYKSYASQVEVLAPDFNTIFTDMTKSFDETYTADIYSAFDGYYDSHDDYDIIQSDGIHPSVSGHKLIADTVDAVLGGLESSGKLPVVTTPVPSSTAPKSSSTTASVPVSDPRATTVNTVTVLLGDADLSGEVNIRDATLIQKATAGISELSDKIARVSAEITGDGLINIRDATAIQKFCASINPGCTVGVTADKPADSTAAVPMPTCA